MLGCSVMQNAMAACDRSKPAIRPSTRAPFSIPLFVTLVPPGHLCLRLVRHKTQSARPPSANVFDLHPPQLVRDQSESCHLLSFRFLEPRFPYAHPLESRLHFVF